MVRDWDAAGDPGTPEVVPTFWFSKPFHWPVSWGRREDRASVTRWRAAA